jgi:hypothetical protein
MSSYDVYKNRALIEVHRSKLGQIGWQRTEQEKPSIKTLVPQ